MSGRPKQKVFRYDFNGKFINSYETISEFRETFYSEDIGVRPLFVNKINNISYEMLENSIAFKSRVYRDNIKYLLAIYHSEYCKKQDMSNNRAVEVLNLQNEVIAIFKNRRLLTKLLPHIDSGTILSNLETGTGRKRITASGLRFRYRDNDN